MIVSTVQCLDCLRMMQLNNDNTMTTLDAET